VQDIGCEGGVERAGLASITVNPMSTGSMYLVANRRVVSHATPMAGYLRALPRSPPRSLVRVRVRADDGRARHAIKMDPLEFRRKNIATSAGAASSIRRRGRQVAAARDGLRRMSDVEVVTGRGIALGTHHVS